MSRKNIMMAGQNIEIDNHEQDIWEWIYPCPYFQELFFGFADLGTLNGQVVILPLNLTKDSEPIAEYINDKNLETYTPMVMWYDTVETKQPNSLGNINQLNDRLKVIWYWCKEQIKKGNLPNIEGIKEIKIKPPNIAGYDETGMKCEFPIIIKFEMEENTEWL